MPYRLTNRAADVQARMRAGREQDDKRYARAKVLGVGRDAENAKTLVVIFDQVPSDDDLRRTHDLLRSNAGIAGAP